MENRKEVTARLKELADLLLKMDETDRACIDCLVILSLEDYKRGIQCDCMTYEVSLTEDKGRFEY